MEMKNSADFVIEEIKSTLAEFLPKAVKAAHLLEADITDQLTMKLDMYPVFLSEANDLTFIPTGTMSSPKGIAVHKGKIIVLFSEKGLIKILSRDAFRQFVKTKTEIFSRGVGPDFETMGIIAKTKEAIAFFNDELLFV
jgi:hypothetical protein